MRLWQLADIELVTSAFAADEAARNLNTDAERERLGRLLDKLAIVDETSLHLETLTSFSLPTKDIPILMAAVQASATHLLTGDKRHFGPFFNQSISGVLILPPADYLATRAASEPSIKDSDIDT